MNIKIGQKIKQLRQRDGRKQEDLAKYKVAYRDLYAEGKASISHIKNLNLGG